VASLKLGSFTGERSWRVIYEDQYELTLTLPGFPHRPRLRSSLPTIPAYKGSEDQRTRYLILCFDAFAALVEVD
jgi:hypothetical protein